MRKRIVALVAAVVPSIFAACGGDDARPAEAPPQGPQLDATVADSPADTRADSPATHDGDTTPPVEAGPDADDAGSASDATDASPTDAPVEACALRDCDGACVDTTTDPNNCGNCGWPCGTDETCKPTQLIEAGPLVGECYCTTCTAPVVAADDVWENDNNQNIATDLSAVYFSENESVWEIPRGDKAGSKIFDLSTLDAGASQDRYLGIGALAVDATYVYVGAQAGAVFKIDRRTHAVTTLTIGQFQLYGLAIDADYVYFTSFHDGLVSRVALAGGASEVLVSGETNPDNLVLAGDHLVWTSMGSPQKVRTAPKTGGAATDVASGTLRPLAAAGGTAYFATIGHLYAFDTSTNAVKPVATVLSAPHGLFANATDIYWAEARGAVERVDFATGTLHTIADSYQSPWSVVSDGSRVFWYDGVNQQILSATP